MTWTAKQAGYQNETLTVVHEDARLTKHYVITRHGAVARTWIVDGSLYVTVALRRPSHKHPQYQGKITRDDAQELYIATDAHGNEVTRAANYVDAEAALLPLRTRTRSQGDYAWPEAIMRGLRPVKPTCGNCGHELVGTVCVRPDLHWTVASLGAQDRRREERRATRLAA